jgi:hypothetical protein
MRGLSSIFFLMLCAAAASKSNLSSKEIAREFREALKKFKTVPQNVSQRLMLELTQF